MNKLTSFLLFASVGSAVNVAMHAYVWVRLVRDSKLARPWPRVLGGVLVALALSVPVTMVSTRLFSPLEIGVVAWPAFIWMGCLFLMVMTLLATDLLRWTGLLVLKLSKAPDDVTNPARRLLLQRTVAGAATLTVGAVSVHGVAEQARGASVKEVEVTLPRLAPEMDGTTLVQMTDIHVGPTVGRAYIEDLVNKTNALTPDIICLTGDLVDGGVAELRRAVEPLMDLHARSGVYFVTGNHEYYSGVDEWTRELERLGCLLYTSPSPRD